MTTILLWQIRQSSKKVSVYSMFVTNIIFWGQSTTFLFDIWHEKEKKNAAWGTYAFIQPNKDAVNTSKGWTFPVRAVFIFSLTHTHTITITSIAACQGIQCESVQQRRSLVFVLAPHTLIILPGMGCTFLSLIWSIAYSVGKGAWMDAQ